MFWFKVCLFDVMTAGTSKRSFGCEKRWVLWGKRWSQASFSQHACENCGKKTWHHCFSLSKRKVTETTSQALLNVTWSNSQTGWQCNCYRDLKNADFQQFDWLYLLQDPKTLSRSKKASVRAWLEGEYLLCSIIYHMFKLAASVYELRWAYLKWYASLIIDEYISVS